MGCGCLTLILIVFLLGWIGMRNEPQTKAPNSSTPTPAEPDNSVKSVLPQVALDLSWKRGGFETVMLADFTVNNGSDYSIKDFEITCKHYANSGTFIDSNRKTVYDIVPAHSTKKFSDFSMGFINSQVATSSCGITDLVVMP